MDVAICLIEMVMSQMNNKEWQEFVLEDVFDLYTGALIPNEIIEYGSIPRITATENNNGIAMFTNHIEHKNFRVFKNFISISFLGSVFYQEGVSSLDMKIHGIKPKEVELNKNIALFLIPLLCNFSSKYSYGNQLSMRLLKRQRMKLPVDSEGNPDWNYIERLGSSIYYKQNIDILRYLVKKMDALEEEINSKVLSVNIEWGLWTIGSLFNTKRVSGRIFESYDKGHLPYVTTSSQRNGVHGFVNAVEEDISFRNSLTISPIDGTIFYHSFDFVGRGGAGSSIITLTNKYLNKYTGLFIKTAIECSSKAKASYGVQLNGDRLKATKFKLPINKDGDPDWDYMELYMKKIEYEKLKKIVDYLQKKLERGRT